ncbi:hypothetical protein FHS18_001177 [Paenibacillus phyllosphaerae]|uniref:GIY-YIG domain-containing protein n=1 Tax=Paenibacillus phyllosphaerae TaxID=274593 RepID=A0A7W5AUP1_9BACL|nr:hypothetical protein [Paenibacillus phyllosphaerae]MBB3109125.1 hypothetical protein [Paenibacillus phyllosphaerae]
MGIHRITISPSFAFANTFNSPSNTNYNDLIITFSKNPPIPWNVKVKNNLESRIGVYQIINSEGTTIYVGKATGDMGLKGRHTTHEKREYFRLFDATTITTYYAEDPNFNDPGILILLERILVYGEQAVLNKDVTEGIPTEYTVASKMLEKIKCISDELHFKWEASKDDEFLAESEAFDDIYQELEKNMNSTKKAELEFNHAIKYHNSEKKLIRDKKKIYKSNFKLLRQSVKSRIKSVNDKYEELI